MQGRPPTVHHGSRDTIIRRRFHRHAVLVVRVLPKEVGPMRQLSSRDVPRACRVTSRRNLHRAQETTPWWYTRQNTPRQSSEEVQTASKSLRLSSHTIPFPVRRSEAFVRSLNS